MLASEFGKEPGDNFTKLPKLNRGVFFSKEIRLFFYCGVCILKRCRLPDGDDDNGGLPLCWRRGSDAEEEKVKRGERGILVETREASFTAPCILAVERRASLHPHCSVPYLSGLPLPRCHKTPF